MKYIFMFLLTIISMVANAGGQTNAAVPTAIHLVQAGSAGFMVFGEFGNVAGCTVSNQVFIEIGHPQYSQIYSTVTAAFMAGKKVAFYSHNCKPVPWYTVNTTTYNTVEPFGAIYLSN